MSMNSVKTSSTGMAAKPSNQKPRNNRLDIRNPPTMVTGIPEELFAHYVVTFKISGMNSITPILHERTESGDAGRFIPYEEVMKLCKAPGFVRAQGKEEARTELTDQTRALFYNAKVDPTKTKDPKSFVKNLISQDANLEKAKVAVAAATDTPEDQSAKGLFCHLIEAAAAATNEINDLKLTGVQVDEKKAYIKKGFPASMKSKILTGSVEVSPGGKLWTTLLGKEPNKFCNLSLTEVQQFPDALLAAFYDEEDLIAIKAATTPELLAVMLGKKTWKEVPQSQKDKIGAYQFPIRPFISKLELLKRYENTKAQVRAKNLDQSIWKPLDVLTNNLLTKYYLVAPSNIADVVAYWDKLAGQTLEDPQLTSKGYRAQTIDIWTEAGSHGTAIGFAGPDRSRAKILLQGQSLKELIEIAKAVSFIDGSVQTTNPVDLEKFRLYQPTAIVGKAKTMKKKDREHFAIGKKKALSAQSKKFLRALKDRGIHEVVLTNVKNYLETFLYVLMQEMAAEIVYNTCLLTHSEARATVLGIQEEEEDDPSGSEDDGSNADEEDDDGEALPEPIKPGSAGVFLGAE